jgi:deazaflavin-dependent oxidoreductase (nitroreductase family)
MVGEMNIRPNTYQKFIHRFVMLRPVTMFLAPRAHRIDKALLKLSQGKFTMTELAGWPIIEITTRGAKSGQPRTMPLIGVVDDEKIALIASNFGREHNPAWYYNLKAHPECDVTFRARSKKYSARELEGAEYDRYWNLAVSYYIGYEKYKERAAPRHIPIMLLESKK